MIKKNTWEWRLIISRKRKKEKEFGYQEENNNRTKQWQELNKNSATEQYLDAVNPNNQSQRFIHLIRSKWRSYGHVQKIKQIEITSLVEIDKRFKKY